LLTILPCFLALALDYFLTLAVLLAPSSFSFAFVCVELSQSLY
jgi:hypothetical protein